MDVIMFNGMSTAVGLMVFCISSVLLITVIKRTWSKLLCGAVGILGIIIVVTGTLNARSYHRQLKEDMRQALSAMDSSKVKDLAKDLDDYTNSSVVIECIEFHNDLKKNCRDGILFSEIDLDELRSFKDELSSADEFYSECLAYIESLTNDDEIKEFRYICAKSLIDKGCVIEGYELLYRLGDYKDSKTLALNCDYLGDVMYKLYTFCKSCVDCKEYDKALEGLKILKEVGYKDSVSLYDLCKKEIKDDK